MVSSKRSATWKFLTTNYSDALAVEMEGYGFLKVALANQQVHALVIRGISDLIDDKTEVDAANTQELAARHASAFAFEVLARLGEVETFRSSRSEIGKTLASCKRQRNWVGFKQLTSGVRLSMDYA